MWILKSGSVGLKSGQMVRIIGWRRWCSGGREQKKTDEIEPWRGVKRTVYLFWATGHAWRDGPRRQRAESWLRTDVYARTPVIASSFSHSVIHSLVFEFLLLSLRIKRLVTERQLSERLMIFVFYLKLWNENDCFFEMWNMYSSEQKWFCVWECRALLICY